jgi:hypothetical protein
MRPWVVAVGLIAVGAFVLIAFAVWGLRME